MRPSVSKTTLFPVLVLAFFFALSSTAFAAPSITSLSPTSGAIGASVTITGTSFGSTQGSSTVKFNGTTATATSWSATSIVASVPSGATTGNVVVTVSGTASNGKSFTVVAAPSITSLSPTSGAVGASVTVTGTNFGSTQGSSTVKFNGTAGTPTSWSATSIKVPVPSSATTGNVVVFASGVNSNGQTFTVLPTPSITSLSPTSGAVGASVTITGTNFGSTQGSSTLKFNTTTATPTSWSATSIVANVPSGATTGNVVVTVSGVVSNGESFTVVSAPSITSLSPTSGVVGTPVTVTGTNFGSTQGSGTVKFNGTAGTPTSWSATSIHVPVPSGATTGNVVVYASGVNSNGESFTVLATPNITSLSPTSGAVGASVTITGTNFGSTQGSSTLKFNTTTATATSWAATSIVATVPSGATTGNVVVTVSGVASNGVSFTVVSAPSISSLSPTSGVVGTPVTVTGTNFGSTQGSSTVQFNGTTGTATNWSATSIQVPVPSGATTGNVVVHASGVNSNGKSFTVTPSPTITSLSPASGAPGTPVTISGTNFGSTQGSSTVQFDGTVATATSWSAASITTTVPNGATSGNVVVTVSGAASNGMNFTVPTLTSISVTPATVSLPIAATQQFTATGTYSDGTQGNITASATWSSTATNVATISTAGTATGVGEGTTTIQATVGTINGSTSLTGTPSPFIFTGSLNTPRAYHTATLLQNGQVLITGGSAGGGTFLGSCELYNPTTGTFTYTGNLLIPRAWHTATLLQNGQVLITGGESDQNGTYGDQPQAELYNPSTGSFSWAGSLNLARSNHTATLLQNGQVLIAGGSTSSGTTATAELYNPATSSFSYTGNLTQPLWYQSATLLNDGTVLIAGGDDLYGSSPVASAELYNPTLGTFAATGNLNTPREEHTATLLGNGQVLIATGENYVQGNAQYLATAELYNPTAKTFSVTGSLANPRLNATANLLSSGSVLITGGWAPSQIPVAPAELYNPTSATFSLAGNLNVPRGSHQSALLNNGTVLIVGGEDQYLDQYGDYVVENVPQAELYQPVGTDIAPVSLQITPATANVLVGGSQTFTAVDNNGNPRQDATWTVSNPSLASVTTNENGTGTLTAIAVGEVTLTATAGTTTAQETVNILAAGSYPTGTVVWSASPTPGFTPIQLVQAVPAIGAPDLYSTQLNTAGTQSMLQAMTADGQQLWQTTLPPLNNNSVPDGFGGVIVTEYDTCTPGQTNPLTVVDLDPIYGQPTFAISAAGVQVGNTIEYCYTPGPTAPQVAVRGDGAVIISGPSNNGFPPLTLVPVGGANIVSYSIPPSTLENSSGQQVGVQCCLGPPMVNSDGTAYVEYEVRNINNSNVITSDYLYLFQINANNSSSSTLLSSTTQNEAQFPGSIIPDGNGGVLATWTISPSNPPVPQYPYQVVDVSAGVVGTPYNLPFSPPTVAFGQSPTLVLGDNGTVLATNSTDTVNGPVVASFGLTSGFVNWSYRAAPQSTLSIVAASAGGGIAINDSQAGVTLLDPNGNPSQIGGTAGSTAQTSVLGNWYLQSAQAFSELLQSPLALAQTFWAFPGGSQSPSAIATQQVQANQTQGTVKQLPPSGATLNTNYNSIEILTTESVGYIFQTYLQTFEGAWPGNNDVATVPTTTNLTGTGQNLTFTLQGIAASGPLVWLGLGQGPFSVQTERFDTQADVISAVTLQGHPLAGWRYWRVYSIGTNDLVIETGAADTNGPGAINYEGYRILKTKQTKIWQEYLQFILNDLRSNKNGKGDPNATQGSNKAYNFVSGQWNPASPSLAQILNYVCQAATCN